MGALRTTHSTMTSALAGILIAGAWLLTRIIPLLVQSQLIYLARLDTAPERHVSRKTSNTVRRVEN